MARGQVTIEFVLILIVVLVIITTVSLPLVSQSEDTIKDTNRGVLLGQEIAKIIGASKDISLAGCGSVKKFRIDKGELDSAVGVYNITIDGQKIMASYYLENGTKVSLKPVYLPSYVNVTCTDDGNVTVKKDCSTAAPSNSCIISS